MESAEGGTDMNNFLLVVIMILVFANLGVISWHMRATDKYLNRTAESLHKVAVLYEDLTYRIRLLEKAQKEVV